MGTPLRQQAAYLLKNMKVISAYMLAVVGGNAKPSAADVKKILSAVGIELDDADNKTLEELVEELSGKELSEVLEAGHKKLKTIPGGSGGGAGPAAGGAAGGASGAAAAAAEEEEEEEDMAPATNLFGDDGDDY